MSVSDRPDGTGGAGEEGAPAPLSFADWLRLSHRLSLDICPNCELSVGEGACCVTYTTWHCWGCGAHLDSRVVSPRTVYLCENEWPDYERRLGDPIHPIACSCSGRGWYAYEDHPTLRSGYARAQVLIPAEKPPRGLSGD